MYVKIVTRNYEKGELKNSSDHIFECDNIFIIDDIFQDENVPENYIVKYSVDHGDKHTSTSESQSKDDSELSIFIMNNSGKTISHYHFKWVDR